MTENEKFECAIHCAKYQAEIEVCEDCKAYNMDSSTCKEIAMETIKAMEEVQEYRKIGTVEELKSLKENVAFTTKELMTIRLQQMELEEYQKIGTVEEIKKSVKEENILKFYYCESEDDYYIGEDMGNRGNMYYAKYGKTGFVWFMSRYLPWGEHIVAPHTLWKEYTYPSEPKEIPFDKWIQGFLKKYCGGSPEECREVVDVFTAKKPILNGDWEAEEGNVYKTWYCPNCGQRYKTDCDNYKHCPECGQKIERRDKNE